MAERYAIGVHNFTDELRQKIVDDGKNLLYGNSEWHRKNAYTQLNNNRHVSQMSKTCEHCGITCSANNYVRHHGAKCFALTGVKNKVSKHKKRQQLTCEQCEKTMDASNFKQHNHGPNCTRKKLNRVVFHSG